MYENMLLHEDEDSASTQCKYSERHQQGLMGFESSSGTKKKERKKNRSLGK
jgi:hypothetical protein